MVLESRICQSHQCEDHEGLLTIQVQDKGSLQEVNTEVPKVRNIPRLQLRQSASLRRR